jgi:cell fate regulator YaaT (PSP1 superfamily)
MHLVEVAFKGNRKEFYAWEGEEPPPLKASVVVEADRGEDLGVVHATGEHAQKRCSGCSHGLGSAEPTRKALRIASTRELRQARELHAQDDTARQKATERVKAHGLVMKLSDAEWQWDRKKLTFYFTADRRVDFRDLVRDLAALFRARIELKQIGVRDEAKRLDGIGRCGRQFCSASWLPELRPVNLGVAKDQHLSLNPSQISGACGRLMCCLRYEHEFDVQSRKRFPKEGKTLVTAVGEEKVVANEIFNERVTLRSAEGETRVVSLAQLRRELMATGHPLPGADLSPADGPGAIAFPLETIEMQDEVESDERESLASAESFDPELEVADEPPTRGARDEGRPEPQPPRASGTPRSDRRERPPRPRTRSSQTRQRREGSIAREVETESPPAVSGGAPTTPQPPATPTVATTAVEKPDGTGAPRRRRGRRGGRRGRGKGGPNDTNLEGSPPSATGDGPTSDRTPDGSDGSGGTPLSGAP